MTEPRFRQTRFIAIRVRDFARAVAFYRDVIGLKLAAATTGEARFEGDANTLFVEAMPVDEAPTDQVVADTRGRYAGKTFFEFEVDDFASARERLLAAGCRESSSGVCGAPSADGSVAPIPCSAMFSDPFGLSYHIYHASAVLPEIDTIRVEARFVGRVQGVGFRATALRLARQWPALAGSVRNERDGSVALVAQGKASEVDGLVHAIRSHWGESISQCALTRMPPTHCESPFAIG
jgi:acylphosphatase